MVNASNLYGRCTKGEVCLLPKLVGQSSNMTGEPDGKAVYSPNQSGEAQDMGNN